MIIKEQEKDERYFPQNTNPNQSNTIPDQCNIEPDQSNTDIPLSKNYTQRHSPSIRKFWITNQKSIELNNIKWNFSKRGNTGGPKKGVEVK